MKAPFMALALLSLSVAGVGRVRVQLPSAVVTDDVGVNIHFLPSWGTTPLSDLDMIQAAGCKYVRMDCTWAGIETTAGQYNFSGTDSLVTACAARGIRVMYILDYGNSLYGSDYTATAWQQGFTNFAKAAAAHYAGDGVIWELWNEPDGGGNMSANTYMALANQAIPAMRAADTIEGDCTILGPAVSCINSAGQSYLTTCFSQGLLNLVDAVSVHPYRDPSPGNPESVATTTSGGQNYTTVRKLINQYKAGVPIVDSEWGWFVGSGGDRPVATAQLQGDYLARSLLINFSQGIPLSIWYDWKNDGSDPNAPEDNFGMVAGETPKPAYQELQLLTRSLKGETFTKRLTSNSQDWLLVFTSPSGQQTLAAWTTRSSPYTLTVSGWGTLQLTSTPFYVDPTLLPGDANLDGRVDVLDLAILAANYRKHVTGGWLQGDFNNDGVVDVQDLALLAANYRQSYASDVVPDYAGFDAAAIQALSQAGITVVPEPSALALLGAGLLAVLVYAWRKQW